MSKSKIGYFPITGDPIHYGHIHGALAVKHKCNLSTVYFQVCGDSRTDKKLYVPKYHRHEMVKQAIRDYSPILKYTDVGYNNNLLGEDNFCTFMNCLDRTNIEMVYYIAGYDREDLIVNYFKVNAMKYNFKIAILIPTPKNNTNIIEYVKFKNPYSSSLFREEKNVNIIPRNVYEYCQANDLYGL
ncbi:MAG: hypothetical protein GY845_08330 [Planctomycetes bacterium]|nr:hypothetical protein [Planctomycetota bacterium]